MSAVAIIPARGGSRRIPRKNIKPFLGRPIIGYAISAAQVSGCFESVWVSTDDEEIARVAASLGARAYPRSHVLAEDGVGTQEVTRNAILEIWPDEKTRPEFACCIYPCSPTLLPNDFRMAHAMLIEDEAKRYAWATGMFYFGRTAAFVADEPLDGPKAVELDLGYREVDINVLADWKDAERIYHRMRSGV